ncbi:L-ascorbate metabolism protein UlaG, beta-lactamase superfamily [Terribacillus aidingensis]|uniref:L-ascorbate metabolism protein UlaG, beta-lactamase superfamily n=1 Tax=Terribacillus aidingensis TaxID=586416 RepID=A0A285P120_9BACI|nr:MBL fold metallo-hydrolase [Terribacillus aidingensis]SNZ15419.1 L-ascorbate metabolism protein UlaG, beta-lactamase superfamily [Terribacillus aidingensis]
MHVKLIRNATLVVDYADKKFIIDPMLAAKGTYPPFPNSVRQDQRNPLVDLPEQAESILEGIDAVILTHLHLDHFDESAKEMLPKDMKIYVQNEEDANEVKESGFTDVEILSENTVFADIQLVKSKGEHGRGEILKRTGNVCGVILKHANEKTLYIAGDTVWYEAIQDTIETQQPEVIVVNGGDNQFLEGGSLVMDKKDILEVAKAAPHATIISVHMEAVNHWGLSREELRHFLTEKEIADKVIVPNDGDSLNF